MNHYERKLVASSELFSGFTVYIDITEVETLDDIVEYFKKKLKETLIKNNFENLVLRLNDTKFHIHTFKIEDILVSSINDTFYVCDHCSHSSHQ